METCLMRCFKLASNVPAVCFLDVGRAIFEFVWILPPNPPRDNDMLSLLIIILMPGVLISWKQFNYSSPCFVRYVTCSQEALVVRVAFHPFHDPHRHHSHTTGLID